MEKDSRGIESEVTMLYYQRNAKSLLHIVTDYKSPWENYNSPGRLTLCGVATDQNFVEDLNNLTHDNARRTTPILCERCRKKFLYLKELRAKT